MKVFDKDRNGALLLAAKEYGYTVTGIDMRQTSIDALKLYIEDLRNMDFLKLRDYEEFDVISFADVIEHVPYPGVFLEQANKLLREDGLVFVSLPNTSAPIWDICNKNNMNPYWGEIEHFHNFSRERLISYLNQHGWTGFFPATPAHENQPVLSQDHGVFSR